MTVDCDRYWSAQPRQRYHAFSTTPTLMTSRPPATTSADVTPTSSASLRRPMDRDGHVTSGENYDWSRRWTLERPPLRDEDEEYSDDTKKTSRRTKTGEGLNTVKHWVKYSDGLAGPSVYRELTNDVADDLDDLHEDSGNQHYGTVERQPDTRVLHVHHVHELYDDGMSVVDVETAKISAAATVALDDDEIASSVAQRPSSGDELLRNDNDLSRARGGLSYNVQEGL